MIKPRPYQTEAVDAIETHEQQGVSRPLIVLPTGTGKTIVFGMHIARRQDRRALVIAHREELINQAVDKIKMVDNSLELGVVKAEQNEVDAQVVVASIQTISRPGRLEQLLPDFGSLIVDEAHHANADTYRKVINYCGGWHQGGPLVMGVTATPERSDYTSLKDTFQHIVYQRSILDMVLDGYLCDMRAQQVFVEINFDEVDQIAGGKGDYKDESLAEALIQANAPDEIVQAYQQYAPTRKGICFTPNIHTAHVIASLFNTAGISAAALDHTTPKDERRGMLEALASGEIKMICNCGVLTEGFDEPSIDVIIIARPTKFRGLYQQMIGRGTRLHPGKQDCLVIDVVGNTQRHNLQTLDKLFELKEKQSILEAEEERREEEEEEPEPAEPESQGALFDEKRKGGKLVAREVDLFKGQRSTWVMSPQGNWILNLGSELGTLRLKQMSGGRWDVVRIGKTRFDVERIISGVTLDFAYGVARDYMRQSSAVMLDRKAYWRTMRATDKQLDFIKDLAGTRPPASTTKGEAADMIAAFRADLAVP